LCADPVTGDIKEPVLDYSSQRRREKLNEIRFVENKLNAKGRAESEESGEKKSKVEVVR
jgi:hypothetical protein